MVLDVTSKNPGNTGSSIRFLMVVDRDAGDLFYTSMLLQRFSYNICSAMTVDEALAMARIAPPAGLMEGFLRAVRQAARTDRTRRMSGRSGAHAGSESE